MTRKHKTDTKVTLDEAQNILIQLVHFIHLICGKVGIPNFILK